MNTMSNKAHAMLLALISADAIDGRFVQVWNLGSLGGVTALGKLRNAGLVVVETRVVGKSRMGYPVKDEFVTVTEAGAQYACGI